MRGATTWRHTDPLDHRPAIVEPCIDDPLALRKALQDLYANFLSDRAFDPPHPVPQPHDFPLFLDIHWPPPKNNQIEHKENKQASHKTVLFWRHYPHNAPWQKQK